MISNKHARWFVLLFFGGLIAIVFYQISTDMADQGIASGGPYDNAAAYPGGISILLGFLLAMIAVLEWRMQDNDLGPRYSLGDLKRPFLLLVVFAAYLIGLGTLGYHLSTPPMIMAYLLLGGVRKPLEIVVSGFAISLIIAFFFEVPLKIVLPGGIFALNIPW